MFAAQFPGSCAWCGQRIAVGDDIYRNKQAGGYCHDGCPPEDTVEPVATPLRISRREIENNMG
jgi:hypothetical protein